MASTAKPAAIQHHDHAQPIVKWDKTIPRPAVAAIHANGLFRANLIQPGRVKWRHEILVLVCHGHAGGSIWAFADEGCEPWSLVRRKAWGDMDQDRELRITNKSLGVIDRQTRSFVLYFGVLENPVPKSENLNPGLALR